MIDTAQHRGKWDDSLPSLPVESSNRHLIQNPLSVIAGTAKGLWQESQSSSELAGSSVQAIASSPDGLWAIVDRNAVWHQSSNRPWHSVATVKNLRLNCLLPLEQAVLVGTSEAHLMQIMGGQLQRIESFEQAEGRDEWYTPWGGLPDVRSLAVGPSGELYVNIHVGGILRSTDQGRSWQPTLDLHADVHEVRTVGDRPGLVVAATAEGLAVSHNSGETWEFDRLHLHATYARAVAVCGDAILMSVSLGPHGGKAALYRRPLDQPGTFEKCQDGLPEWFSNNINTGCLVASGAVAVFGTQDGQIFRSQDAGHSWEQVASELEPIHCLSLV